MTETITGTLGSCAGGWCVGEVTLDLGPSGALLAAAAADYDRDGVVETLDQELGGLATAGPVSVHGQRTGAVLVVQQLAGSPFPR